MSSRERHQGPPGWAGWFLAALILLVAAGPDVRGSEPDRVTLVDGQFMVNGHRLWINGANTPWHHWNDFGGSFDEAWWDAQFGALRAKGINATRVWIACSGEVGVLIDPNGGVAGATAAHWHDLDRLFLLAAKHRLHLMATLMSFDHFRDNHPYYQRWRNWIADDRNIDSYVDHYLVPFLDRYGRSPWLWSIDLMNEPDWVYEKREDGRIPWERLQSYFARAARAIHAHSPVLATVGMAMPKYNSDTAKNCLGNKVSDRALQALVPDPTARLDFYTTHYYDWNGKIWGNAVYLTPDAYQMPTDKPSLLGEMPAVGTSGHSLTADYESAFRNGWLGAMAWTSNGVDRFGSLVELGAATRAFRARHPAMVNGAPGP